MKTTEMKDRLQQSQQFGRLYGHAQQQARQRCLRLIERYQQEFSAEPCGLFPRREERKSAAIIPTISMAGCWRPA